MRRVFSRLRQTPPQEILLPEDTPGILGEGEAELAHGVRFAARPSLDVDSLNVHPELLNPLEDGNRDREVMNR